MCAWLENCVRGQIAHLKLVARTLALGGMSKSLYDRVDWWNFRFGRIELEHWFGRIDPGQFRKQSHFFFLRVLVIGQSKADGGILI